MTNKVRVFLSYRRADTQHVAGRVADKLGETYELFMDIDTIPPGVDFTDYVRRAVGSCDVLLAFIGERWLELTDDTGRRRIDDPQDWVAEEISVALRRGVRVIPVLVDGASIPQVSELPPALAPLVGRQALSLHHGSFSADLARLVAGIEHAGADRRRAADEPASSAADPGPSTHSEHSVRPDLHFADRWDAPAHPAPSGPPVLIRLPARRLPSKRLIVGLASIVLAALVGVGFAITRPFQHSATPQGTATSPGQPSGSSLPAASPGKLSPVPGPARTLQQLRSHLPPAFSRTCTKLNPQSEILRASLLLAVQCVPSQGTGRGKQPAYSFYFQYAGPDTALAAFHGYYASGQPTSGDCRGAAGELPYDRPPAESGTLRCYQDAEGFRVFAWTDDDLSILASAADRTMTYAELARWWDQAGPVR